MGSRVKSHLATAVLAAVIAGTSTHFFAGRAAPEHYAGLVAEILADEGFRGYQYLDTRGRRTIAYGILLPLTKAEGRALAIGRLRRNGDSLARGWPAWRGAGPKVRGALLRMTFQLGAGGVLGFHEMLAALARKDYERAALEALDSKWDGETPHRAEEVAAIFRSLQ